MLETGLILRTNPRWYTYLQQSIFWDLKCVCIVYAWRYTSIHMSSFPSLYQSDLTENSSLYILNMKTFFFFPAGNINMYYLYVYLWLLYIIPFPFYSHIFFFWNIPWRTGSLCGCICFASSANFLYTANLLIYGCEMVWFSRR